MSDLIDVCVDEALTAVGFVDPPPDDHDSWLNPLSLGGKKSRVEEAAIVAEIVRREQAKFVTEHGTDEGFDLNGFVKQIVEARKTLYYRPSMRIVRDNRADAGSVLGGMSLWLFKSQNLRGVFFKDFVVELEKLDFKDLTERQIKRVEAWVERIVAAKDLLAAAVTAAEQGDTGIAEGAEKFLRLIEDGKEDNDDGQR